MSAEETFVGPFVVTPTTEDWEFVRESRVSILAQRIYFSQPGCKATEAFTAAENFIDMADARLEALRQKYKEGQK